MVQTYIMSGMKSDFTTKYSPPISLDESKQYEAALLSIDLFNPIPNITNLRSSIKDVRMEGGRGGLIKCGQLRTGGEGGSEAKRTSAKK